MIAVPVKQSARVLYNGFVNYDREDAEHQKKMLECASLQWEIADNIARRHIRDHGPYFCAVYESKVVEVYEMNIREPFITMQEAQRRHLIIGEYPQWDIVGFTYRTYIGMLDNGRETIKPNGKYFINSVIAPDNIAHEWLGSYIKMNLGIRYRFSPEFPYGYHRNINYKQSSDGRAKETSKQIVLECISSELEKETKSTVFSTPINRHSITRNSNLMKRLKLFFDEDLYSNPASFYPFIHNIEDEQTEERLNKAYMYYSEYLQDDMNSKSKECIEDFFLKCRDCLKNHIPIPIKAWKLINDKCRDFVFAELKTTLLRIIEDKLHKSPESFRFSESWHQCPGISIKHAIDREYIEQFWVFLLENLYKHGGGSFVCSIRNDDNKAIAVEIYDKEGTFDFEWFTRKHGGARPIFERFKYGYIAIISDYSTWSSKNPIGYIDEKSKNYTIKVSFALPN